MAESFGKRPLDELDKAKAEPRQPAKLMWLFGAALLFLIGAGFYVSSTRDHQGNKIAAPVAAPAPSDNAVPGGRSMSGQTEGGAGTADTTGRQTTTGQQ
jgi:hypothetical protein